MLDCSRNAVPRVEAVKMVLRKMALMGLNTLMLYTEDTYEVPEQPISAICAAGTALKRCAGWTPMQLLWALSWCPAFRRWRI